MEEHIVKILKTEPVTHNVRRFTLEKPTGYKYIPGQATEICINQPEWKEERRPFTFTSLNDWDHLEFTIKIYDDHSGVTSQLGKLKTGDELILHDIWGTINYHGEGTFIAGGAGVTPFIAILRQLHKDQKLGDNHLLFSNKTEKDIILKDEFSRMLGKNFINTLTEEKNPRYDNARIDEAYLKNKISNFSQYFYVCGPDPMVEGVQGLLLGLGAEKSRVIIEQF
jgi:ferredoxin-NADP reductase